MMVFDIGDMGHCIDEAHRPVEVRELEFAFERLAVFDELPTLVGGRWAVGGEQAAEHRLRFRRGERADATVAGHALLVDQGVVGTGAHAVTPCSAGADSLRAKLRAMYFSTSSWNSSAMRSPLSVTVFSPSS